MTDFPFLERVVIEEHGDDRADARTSSLPRRPREAPGLGFRADHRRELEFVRRGEPLAFGVLVPSRLRLIFLGVSFLGAKLLLLAPALLLALEPLRLLRRGAHAPHLDRAPHGLHAEQTAPGSVEPHVGHPRLVRSRHVPDGGQQVRSVRDGGSLLRLRHGNPGAVLVRPRRLLRPRLVVVGYIGGAVAELFLSVVVPAVDGEEVEPVVGGSHREPPAGRVHVHAPALRAERRDGLRAVLGVQIPHLHRGVLAAGHQPDARGSGGWRTAAGGGVRLGEDGVRDLILVSAQAAQTRLRDDVPYHHVGVLASRHQHRAARVEPQRGHLRAVPLEEHVGGCVVQGPESDGAVGVTGRDEVATLRTGDARHRGQRAGLARRREEALGLDTATHVPHGEALQRRRHQMLAGVVVDRRRLGGGDDAEGTRLLVAQVRLYHGEWTRRVRSLGP